MLGTHEFVVIVEMLSTKIDSIIIVMYISSVAFHPNVCGIKFS